MDFTLSREHEMARTLFRDFAETEVKPLAQEVDETEVFPRGTVDKMAKIGFLGISVPKEYGGQGCDPLTYAMCVEELSKVCGTTGVIVSAQGQPFCKSEHQLSPAARRISSQSSSRPSPLIAE